jgi:aminotransferase EvaB
VYAVRHPERDRILSLLEKEDVHLNVSYRWPIHTMPAFADSGARIGDLPQTEVAARELFSLPMFPSLDERTQYRFCEILRRVLRQL